MKNLKGFNCQKGLEKAKYKYGNTKIEGETTTMLPEDTITVEKLLNTLKQINTNNKSYISICRNSKNTYFREINNTDGIKKYFSSIITGILCIETKNSIYYDVTIDNEEFKFQPIS